jgi:hypothetical protein
MVCQIGAKYPQPLPARAKEGANHGSFWESFAFGQEQTVYDPGCVKTPQAQKRGESISQINQDWRMSLL